MAIALNNDGIESISKVLKDPNRPIKERCCALWVLRSLGQGQELALKCIRDCFNDESVLLKINVVVALDQMRDDKALRILINVLQDSKHDPIVRHAAGKSLGVISKYRRDVRPQLEKYQNDPAVEVAETCQIALQQINWDANNRNNNSPSSSPMQLKLGDPVPATPSYDVKIEELRRALVDENKSLFERYRAVTDIRKIYQDLTRNKSVNLCGTVESINAIGEGLNASSLFLRHEVATILKNFRDCRSVPFLIKALENTDEHELVRYIAAEALGYMTSKDDACTEVLNRYLNDSRRLVRQACEMALDNASYEDTPEIRYAFDKMGWR